MKVGKALRSKVISLTLLCEISLPLPNSEKRWPVCKFSSNNMDKDLSANHRAEDPESIAPKVW